MAGPRRIGVLTSGGDASGMNAAIRAVVRTSLDAGVPVSGVRRGYAGLLSGDFLDLRTRDVSGILQRGGTILGTARCPAFQEAHSPKRAIDELQAAGIDGLIVIGGNGTQAGAHALALHGYPVIGLASTVDNDLPGTDIALGVDSALAVAVEALDRIAVTATSHERAFLVEVMGRSCGYLALMAGIAGAAELIVIPESTVEPEEIATALRRCYLDGKGHAVVVVSEGATYNAERLSAYFAAHRERLGFELRVTVLGHAQRGGTPTVFDRLLGSRLGNAAAAALVRGGSAGTMVGWLNGRPAFTPLAEVAGQSRPLDLSLLALARTLSR